MPKVLVQDLQHVVIDGVMAGSVVDAMANYRDQSADIQVALVAWSVEFAALAVQHGTNELQAKLDSALSDLTAATGRVDQLTAQLAEQQKAYEADCNTLKAAYEAKLQELNDACASQVSALQNQLKATVEAYEKQVAELAKAANDQITALQGSLQKTAKDLDWHQRRANLATEMINHLYTGDTPAAVASTLELRRIELTSRQAQLDAEMKALEPAA